MEDDGRAVDWSSLIQEECSGASGGVGEWWMGTVGSGGGAKCGVAPVACQQVSDEFYLLLVQEE